MAPRRGGSGGGGSSGGSSSSCSSDYPCTSELNFIYGHRPNSLWNNDELYGQLVASIIWGIAFVILLALKRPRKKWYLLSSLVLFFAAFAFLSVRYGIIVGGNNVPIAYRYEHSIVVLLERLAMPLLLLAVHTETAPGLLSKAVFRIAAAIYMAVNVAYAAYDFLVSADALENFKNEGWVWRLGDRDFILTMTDSMITELKTGSTGTGLSPGYVRSRIFDILGTDNYMDHRDTQVKVGLAADAFAFVLVLLLGVFVVLTVWKRKDHFLRRNILLFVAIGGLLLATLFQVIVTAHYIFNNWKVINDLFAWSRFFSRYLEQERVFDSIIPPSGFLAGYRITITGFPVVQAILVPLGIVMAAASVAYLALQEAKEATTHAVDHSTEPKEYHHQPHNGSPPSTNYIPSNGYTPSSGYNQPYNGLTH